MSENISLDYGCLTRQGKFREAAVPQRGLGWSLLAELVGPDN